MKFTKTEEAVSPVIGVILMVAITVILAAVIGAFVFNIAGSTSSSKTVAITSTTNSDDKAILTIQGGPDLKSVKSLSVKVGDATPESWSSSVSSVGSTYTTSNTVSSKRVMVVGTFNDGSSQILFDKQF